MVELPRKAISSTSKPDKFLVSMEWEDVFSPVGTMASLGLDQTTLLYYWKGKAVFPGRGRFNFRNMWTPQPRFMELVGN